MTIISKRIKSIRDYVKRYFDIYTKKYSFVNTFIIGTILTAIIVFIDYKDIPSNFLSSLLGNLLYSIVILWFVLVSLFGVKYKVMKNVRSPLVNRIDFFIILTSFSLVLFRVTAVSNYDNLTSKTSWVNYILPFLIGLFAIRIVSTGKEVGRKESTIVDLKQILDKTIGYTKPFLIREDAVGYDLLKRDNLLKDLVRTIQDYTSDEKFVISLEGNWGSGKTTFLNNLVSDIGNDENFVIINDFEPWLSESKESLLNNLLNTILTRSNLDISKREIDFFIKVISETILGKKYVTSIFSVIEDIEQDRVSNIISDINYMIDKNGKRIIFIIDNLDRLRPESVYLVLNIVNNVLNFNNLAVILSYDVSELKKGLSSINISPQYIDKIVQKKIVIPPVEKSHISSLYLQIIMTMFNEREIQVDMLDVQKFTNVLSKHQVGIRDFKRFMNSSVLPFVFNPRKISVIDYLVIEYIRLLDSRLYESIYFNQEYFVSSDLGIENSFKYINEEKFDTKITCFFNDVGIENDLVGNLLMLSFPYVTRYFGEQRNYKNVASNFKQDSSYQKVQKNKRISSGKFFDLYFIHDTNLEATIIDLVESFIENACINYRTPESIKSKLDELLDIEEELQTEFLSNFSLYVDDIPTEPRHLLGKLLLENYSKFGNYKGFLTLDTKNRVALVISELIENIKQRDFEDLLIKYIIPKNLTMISNIRYWLKHSIKKNNNEKLAFVDLKFSASIEKILSEKINLFEKKLYTKGNARQVHFYLEKKDSSDRYKEYLQSCINEETYFRILNDLVATSMDTLGYSYSMFDNFDTLIDLGLLKKYNEEVVPINDKQKLLKDIFDNQVIGEKDDYGDIAIRMSDPVDLTTID
ncbi:KAP family NTPase [Enterococcus casseliflavus]|nr:KAP family NTPase [Enterococcus casseliflavus]